MVIFRSPLLAVALACGLAPASGCNVREDDRASASTRRDRELRLPCDVSALLEAHCVRCHGSTPREGAPMSLLRASDFQRTQDGIRQGERVKTRIEDAMRPMPPAPAPRLTQAERELLSAFIDAGASADPDGCVVGESDQSNMDAGARANTDASWLADAAARAVEPSDWAMFGGDHGNTRANTRDSAITRENVATLERVWQVATASTSSVPVVRDNTVYVPTWGATLHALDVVTGAERWQAALPALVDSSAAATASSLYVSDGRGWVHALERGHGELSWSAQVEPHPQAHLWSSPIHVPATDSVLVGTASYEEVVGKDERTFRGSLVALDALDGSEQWRFYTTAGDERQGPGVAIWSTVSVDLDRELIYVGTGNNYAAPASPLSDAMLALDLRSGQLEWSHQFLADDIFSIAGATGPDWDIGSSANLFSAGDRGLVGIGIKSGVYAALDRDTGELVWSTQVGPGGLFGGIISASAYAAGRVFVLCNDASTGEVIAAALDAQQGSVVWDVRLPGQSFSGVAYVDGAIFAGTMDGTLRALDADTGDTLWQDTLPGPVASPVVASGTLVVTFGYSLTLAETAGSGSGGVVAYAPSR